LVKKYQKLDTFGKPIALKPFCLFILLLSLSICNAQPYYFRHYQVEHGLSNNTVYCSLQDKQGFMWMGTKDGLNRFDGYTFKIFRHNQRDPRSISNNMVHTLSLDGKGNIWVGTDSGLDLYNPQSETFTHVNAANKNSIKSIIVDSVGNCWFIAGPLLLKYDTKAFKIISYQSHQNFEATSIASVKGTIWVSSSTGTLEKLDQHTAKFTSYNVFKNSKPVASNFIEKIYATGNSKLLIGTTSQGVKEFDCNTNGYRDLLTYNPDKTEIYVRDFLKYNDHEIWIATESGLFIYDQVKGVFTNLRKQYNDPYSISDNAIYSVYKDSEGGVWAGTYFGGINYYPKQYSLFTKYYPGSNKNTLRGNVVREICKDKFGNLWMGTEDNGLNKLAPDKKTWTHYCPGAKNGLSNNNIHGLLANDDHLLIGTFERGLNTFNIKTGKVEHIYLANKGLNALKSNFIICFAKTRSGITLVGTTRGLYRFNQKEGSFSLIHKVLINSFIYAITEDHNGIIWLGTVHDGIYCYNPNNETVSKLAYKYALKDGLQTSTINGIFEDSKGTMWFATEGLGLWRYNPKSRSCKVYDSQNGLPSDYAFRILEDNSNNVWISTTRGLVCLNLATDQIKTYTKANGLLSDQFNYNSGFKNNDGTLYFGCVKGMISFNPDRFINNNFVAPVYLTGFQIHNKDITAGNSDSILKQSIILTKSINLNYDQSSFSIDFAALSYPSPEMNQYKYMMKGLDKGWTYLKTNRKVFFTQLQPGKYTFIVKAINNDGKWSSRPTELEINIAPPIWKSALAYILYGSVLLISLYYVFRRYHIRTLEKNDRFIERLENDKEKEIYNAKIEFFTNIAHEIRTPLTLIKGPMEHMLKRAEKVPEIHEKLKVMERNTDRLLNLTNQLLDFRKTESSEISLSFVKTDVTGLLTEVYSQFVTLTEQKDLTYRLITSDEKILAYTDREAVKKIVTNLISNAVKYAHKLVEIELSNPVKNAAYFTVTIRNDGHLIPHELSEKIFEPFFRMKANEKQTGTGIGLALSRSLTDLHKGSLVLGPSVQKLNHFVLTLPVHQEKEFELEQPYSTPIFVEPTITADSTGTHKPLILVVDDNAEILDFISEELSENYVVTKAINGQEALAKIKSENIQLVISDIMMPLIDGLDLCKRVKTDFDYSHIPIILLTAKNTPASKLAGLDVGADAYIEKPFSPYHLKMQIANLLDNRKKLKEYFASSPLAHIKSMAYSKPDESFLIKLNAVISDNMQNTELDVEHIAGLLNMSKPTLFRKVKAISNLSINELINITRLKVAAKLLEEGNYKIYEVANMVGYSSQSQLGRNFLKQFGSTPSEYLHGKHKTAIKAD
jgi:ligand-binding sensor domain-containing protein/signal transduction histidine kinase/DNA-binding response OmpR family regulator